MKERKNVVKSNNLHDNRYEREWGRNGGFRNIVFASLELYVHGQRALNSRETYTVFSNPSKEF